MLNDTGTAWNGKLWCEQDKTLHGIKIHMVLKYTSPEEAEVLPYLWES